MLPMSVLLPPTWHAEVDKPPRFYPPLLDLMGNFSIRNFLYPMSRVWKAPTPCQASPRFPLFLRTSSYRHEQDVEKACPEHSRRVRQLCSRGTWRLDVLNRVRRPFASPAFAEVATKAESGFRAGRSLAAAALDGLFDHPAGYSDAVPDLLAGC